MVFRVSLALGLSDPAHRILPGQPERTTNLKDRQIPDPSLATVFKSFYPNLGAGNG
jgi:hypothetical protein